MSGKTAIPRLKELYEHDDILLRVLAGLSLYYLEDDTAVPLIRRFVEGNERGLLEIERRWHWDLAGGYAFEHPLKYLPSPRTQALLLERARHSGDTSE